MSDNTSLEVEVPAISIESLLNVRQVCWYIFFNFIHILYVFSQVYFCGLFSMYCWSHSCSSLLNNQTQVTVRCNGRCLSILSQVLWTVMDNDHPYIRNWSILRAFACFCPEKLLESSQLCPLTNWNVVMSHSWDCYCPKSEFWNTSFCMFKRTPCSYRYFMHFCQ